MKFIFISLFAVSTYAQASFNYGYQQNLPDGTVYFSQINYSHDNNSYAIKSTQNNANLACETFLPNSKAIQFHGYYSSTLFTLDFSEQGDITSVLMGGSEIALTHLRCSL